MDKLNVLLAVAVIALLFLSYHIPKNNSNLISQNNEPFVNEEPCKGNPFQNLLGMTRYKYVKDGECCDVWPVGKINTITCEKPPLFPEALDPKENKVQPEDDPFHALAPKSGYFTFAIPELKFDGIWSRKENSCNWSTCNPEKMDTYGADNLSRTPMKSLYGKVITTHGTDCALLDKRLPFCV